MSTRTTPDIKHGDRVTVLAGKARNPRTYAVLARDFTIEVTHVGSVDRTTGTVEIDGVVLTATGTYASSSGNIVSRSAIVGADGYTVPIRLGDTVRIATGETAVVTAIDECDDGRNLAALRFASGEIRTSCNLAQMEHLARPGETAAGRSSARADEQVADGRSKESAPPRPDCAAEAAAEDVIARPAFADLPEGVLLPEWLTDAEARELLASLAVRFGWVYAVWDRVDLTHELSANADGQVRYEPTDEQFDRVVKTSEWDTVSEVAYRSVEAGGVLREALLEAGLECVDCGTPLTDPPEATGRLCGEHRVGPAGEPAVVDPVTGRLYRLAADTLMYAGSSEATLPRWGAAPVDYAELDPLATARALDAEAALRVISSTSSTPTAGCDAGTGAPA